MEWLEIFENILLFFVGSSTTDSYPASTSFLYNFLGFSLWADDLSDIVSLSVVDSLLGKINLFELLEWFVVFRWYKAKNQKKNYLLGLIFMQSSINEILSL